MPNYKEQLRQAQVKLEETKHDAQALRVALNQKIDEMKEAKALVDKRAGQVESIAKGERKHVNPFRERGESLTASRHRARTTLEAEGKKAQATYAQFKTEAKQITARLQELCKTSYLI